MSEKPDREVLVPEVAETIAAQEILAGVSSPPLSPEDEAAEDWERLIDQDRD